MPDPVFGEKACAFVVPKARQSPRPDRAGGLPESPPLRQLQAARAAGTGVEPPTSLVGKILKRQLRESIAERLRAEAAG